MQASSFHAQSAKYSQTPPYGQPLNTDTSLLRTFCFVPGERKPGLRLSLNSTRLIRTRTFSMAASVSVLTGFQAKACRTGALFSRFWANEPRSGCAVRDTRLCAFPLRSPYVKNEKSKACSAGYAQRNRA